MPLSLNDVEALNISVEKSWNGEKISNTLEDIEKRMGASPVYVISDNASIMRKGVRDSSLIHLPDVGHTTAMFLERQCKNAPDFLSLMKELGLVKNREIMRSTAYLLPPR